MTAFALLTVLGVVAVTARASGRVAGLPKAWWALLSPERRGEDEAPPPSFCSTKLLESHHAGFRIAIRRADRHDRRHTSRVEAAERQIRTVARTAQSTVETRDGVSPNGALHRSAAAVVH